MKEIGDINKQALAAHKRDISGYLNYSKTFRAEKIKDKTGWSVRPENQKVMKGK